ncbi:putative pentatricopeptide repeat-containing protein At3g01580 [Pistacia vera]|uniref:putative pentatricopeptide repeat-containing protein At3g01580 n=1 Tax=Pistacia vera TaxID=55513 RepID=UPI0012635DE4|nr:putative pentatricopeptide repeat-containing protein At3g01580 [Pistacia vera]
MNLFSLRFRMPAHEHNQIPTNPFVNFFSNLSGNNNSSAFLIDKISSCFENCKDTLSLKKLHACVFTWGLRRNTFLGSQLVISYAHFGFLNESRWVFDRIVNTNLSFWNSVLVGYFRTGYFNEVLGRYKNWRESKIGLDGFSVTFSLKSCVELGCLRFGRVVHGDSVKFGLSMDRFVGSSLIGLYSKYGDLGDASKVFDEITEKDVVVYTSMITGFAQCGDDRVYDAFDIASDMQKEQLDPNRVTLVSLLQAAAQLGMLKEGRSVHGYAIRRKIGLSDEVFETTLMDMYIKCGKLKTVACLFGKMNMRCIGCWNAVIAGHLQMGQPWEALSFFCLMMQEHVVPDQISLANGILCCADLIFFREGKSIHGYITRNGFQLDQVATTALVDLYSKCNNLVQARNLFEGMERRDVISYNVMMSSYLQNELASKALELFIEMVRTGTQPNLGAILPVLSALSDLKDTRRGKCVHGYVFIHGFHGSNEIANQIINMYTKCGCLTNARRVFSRIRYRDLVSWTSMMKGYLNHGQANEALILFRIMKEEKVDHDSVALMSLLQALSQLGYLSLAKEVHCHLYRSFVDGQTPIINCLITTYAKCGKLDMARNLFEHMNKQCLTSWNTMIAAHGMHGNCLEALELFGKMKSVKLEPDEVSFTSILSACSHSGLVEEGMQIYKSMTEEYSIIPCAEHYGCIVDLLSRAGRLEEAFNMIKCMPSTKSASALAALVAACRVYGNREMGEVIGRRILELEPENSSAYSLVSNLFAEGGKWDEVAKIKAMVKEKRLKLTSGYSLIELDK